MPKLYGRTEPRIWTKPLRELTPETSLGFEVIAFALEILGIKLYPWQEWLLIHALELREDGTYRYRRILVLVARQQGKTTLASVLAAWWLYVDSARYPSRVPPLKFKVVGVAQNLDIAREPWSVVKMWSDPKPETVEEAALAIDALQDATAKVVDTNGKESIVARSRAHYEIRAAANARGKPAARVLMDEMREQKDWRAWNAVSQTTKSFFNGMLFGFSNAGDASAVVLRQQRDAALTDIADFERYVEDGIRTAEDYANDHDVSLGIFEWSAPDGCAKDDVDAILQANPSIGYGAMTVQSALADIRGMTDAGYRTEVLCQWVTAKVDSFILLNDWKLRHRPVSKIKIPRGARTVWSLDTSIGRDRTWIAAATYTKQGKVFATVRTVRPGMIWAPDYLAELAEASGHREVVVSEKGCPALEFIEKLEELGLIVHKLGGTDFAIATGRMKDLVRDDKIVLVEQPDVDVGIEGGVAQKYQDNEAWSRYKSLPVDISGVIAETQAVYGLEKLEPPKPAPAVLPPPARLVSEDIDDYDAEENLATVGF